MEEQDSSWKNMIIYGVAWFIACVLLILALLNTFELVRDSLSWITAAIDDVGKRQEFEWTVAAITQGMFFVGGCLAVGLAIGFEYYFRLGEKKGLLVKRVATVFVTLIAIIIVSVLVRIIVPVILF
jgi:hypothetical protein